jgi:branched-chain amino acid transport system ATP-binding protein
MLELRGLSVAYGPVRAVEGLSLQVRAGEVVALVGANGAGKSSTLKAIAGMAPVTQGQILMEQVRIDTVAAHRRPDAGIALSPEGRQVFPDMGVRENLEMGAAGAGRTGIGARVEEMFALFPRLRERRAQAAGTLSGGEQQMLAIARALMCRPRMLMLDEPTLGLAPIIVRQIAAIVGALRAQGLGILLSEQNVEMALAVSDRTYVLESGRLVRSGSSAELAGDPAIQTAYLGL